MHDPAAFDRSLGCLLGLATGDALGTSLEFTQPGTFPPLQELTGGGPFHLKPGEWTDDASMALCLAESLVERGGFDPLDQLERYRCWYREGHWSVKGYCFDIGNTIRTALECYESTGRADCGATGEYSAGNGSIMRLAPVAIFYARRPAEAIEKCGQSSLTTHALDICVEACRYLGALLVGALQGASKAALLSERYSPVPGFWEAHPLETLINGVAGGSFLHKEPPEIRGDGFVARSLEAALWAFAHSASFQEGALLAVNLGEDADTTGAVYGQLAGAFYGASGLPAAWRQRLALGEAIEALAARLWELGPD